MNIKQNVRITVQQTSIDIFLNQTLSKLTDYLFQLIQTNVKNQCVNAKRHKTNTYYLSKGVINNYNGKNVKRFEEIGNLTTRQDYTRRLCLLDYAEI